LSRPGLSDPGVCGIVDRLHGPNRLVAGEDVQVIAGVTLGDGKDVVALGNEKEIAVADDVGVVNAAVGGGEALKTETIGWVDPVVVDLFEVGFRRKVADVVLVGWIAGPVATRGEHLDDEQAMSGELWLDDVVDLARRVAGAADLDLYVLGSDQLGWERLLG